MNTAIYPQLTTERLTLRRLLIDDYQAIFDLRSDPEINRFLERQLCKTSDEAKDFINKVNANIENGDSYYWAIVLNDTKTLVGTICLFAFSEDTQRCEMGYELMTKFQGQGIMKEAVAGVIDFVFQVLKLQKIVATIHIYNKQSMNLLLRFNFEKSIETDKENPNLAVFILTSGGEQELRDH